jgi:4-amino-4-deoxy-L-arabinose transferase-like glycosyltransferase
MGAPVLQPIKRLLGVLTDPRGREPAVLLLLAVYAFVWTIYGVIAKGSQDIHADMAELVTWGRSPALGYLKHPPMAAWLVAAWFKVFPVAEWSYYLLAMVTATAGLWVAWRISADYLGAEKRVLALALLSLIPFFNFHALKFNVNTVLIPLWALTALCFLRSLETRSAPWAALAGASAGAAMLGKYWSIFLLAGLAVAALLDSERARYFRSAAPWITIGVGATLIAPHVM